MANTELEKMEKAESKYMYHRTGEEVPDDVKVKQE